MTATDEMCRLLDERGVKWTSERVSDGVLFTFTKDGHTYSVFVRDRAGLEIWSNYLTPAQAIAATLGSGTVEKAVERIEVLSGFAREYLHRYGMLMSMAGEDVTDEVLAVESVINEVCGRKVEDE